MILPKSLGFVAALALALALQAATGCSGSEFAGEVAGSAGSPDAGAAGNEARAGTNGSGASTSGGTPGSGGSQLGGCRGPEDCSDGDPCTQDVCRKDGVCVLSPTCARGEKCCEGSCGECCDDQDCDDAVGCTEDICFAGTCQHLPDSDSCGAGQYCSLIGGCMAFLWYNSHPAEVFMGDTGSLALGGLIGVMAFMIHQPFTLVIVGGVFVAELLSVVIQIGWFKYTKRRFGEGRRVFLMAPIHHHFQKKGWPETKVVLRFWVLSLGCALAGLATLKLR